MRRAQLSWLVALALAGCEAPHPLPLSAPPPASPRVAGAHFDPTTTGTIRGRVSWSGPRPTVARLRAVFIDEKSQVHPTEYTNPNEPLIGTEDGVAGAVVSLNGVEPERGRPWDWPLARVEFSDGRLIVRQGDSAARIGFARRGDALEVTARDDKPHGLRARGAAFFALPLPAPGQTQSRALERRGLVELTSSLAYVWQQGYLFVDDHPYFALTDAAGRFTLPQVPEGNYELTAWLPHWRIARTDYDPDTAQPLRHFFAAPLTVGCGVTVTRGTNSTADLSFAER